MSDHNICFYKIIQKKKVTVVQFTVHLVNLIRFTTMADSTNNIDWMATTKQSSTKCYMEKYLVKTQLCSKQSQFALLKMHFAL